MQIPTGGAAHFTFKLDFVYDVIVQLTHRANERARRASDMSVATLGYSILIQKGK